jgi:hypothetical protein
MALVPTLLLYWSPGKNRGRQAVKRAREDGWGRWPRYQDSCVHSGQRNAEARRPLSVMGDSYAEPAPKCEVWGH